MRKTTPTSKKVDKTSGNEAYIEALYKIINHPSFHKVYSPNIFYQATITRDVIRHVITAIGLMYDKAKEKENGN